MYNNNPNRGYGDSAFFSHQPPSRINRQSPPQMFQGPNQSYMSQAPQNHSYMNQVPQQSAFVSQSPPQNHGNHSFMSQGPPSRLNFGRQDSTPFFQQPPNQNNVYGQQNQQSQHGKKRPNPYPVLNNRQNQWNDQGNQGQQNYRQSPPETVFKQQVQQRTSPPETFFKQQSPQGSVFAQEPKFKQQVPQGSVFAQEPLPGSVFRKPKEPSPQSSVFNQVPKQFSAEPPRQKVSPQSSVFNQVPKQPSPQSSVFINLPQQFSAEPSKQLPSQASAFAEIQKQNATASSEQFSSENQILRSAKQESPAIDSYDSNLHGKTTVFNIQIAPNATVFRYNVSIFKCPENKKKQPKELTKQNDAGMKSVQKQCCTDIINALFGKTQGFGVVDCQFVYDGKRNLFTTKEIKINEKTRLYYNNLSERAALFVQREPVEVTIVPNERVFQLDYSDLKTALVNAENAHGDRSVKMFLEILTSQFLINSGTYQAVSAGCLFQNETFPLVDGMQTRKGFSKGVKIGGTVENPQALMILDMKRTAFFARQTVSEIFLQFINSQGHERGAKQFVSFMRGVKVFLSYNPSRHFAFKCLTPQPLNQIFVKGQSIPQYMAQAHNVHLQYPTMPGVNPDQPNFQKVVYPMECLEILPGQLVPMEKLHTSASQRLLAENSIPAKERFDYMMRQVREIATKGAGQFLMQFGVKIDLQNDLTIHQRHLPSIHVGDNKTIPQNPKANWFAENQHAKFIDPSTALERWIVAFDGSPSSRIPERDVRKFVEELLIESRRAGMTVSAPIGLENAPVSRMDEIFQKAANNGIQFILYIDNKNTKSHDKLKLYEAYYKILTQHITSKNMKNTGPQTLKNVTMKLNTKSFGLCYVPDVEPDMKEFSLDNEDLLIIGIDLAHPTKMLPKDKFMLKKQCPGLENKHPSIVGVSANKLANRWGFAGDFFYQPHESDIADKDRLQVSVQQLVQAFKESKRQPPKRVIILRDGLSEGQEEAAIQTEIPAIKEGICDVYPDLEPKICYVVGTKRHHKRIYRFQDNGEILPTQAGDIVDSDIVRQDVTEFYQQCHYPLKGVPKMLQITVLLNELEMTTESIQKLLLILSSNHQISACATSLPTPIMVAHETAKRGFNIYNELYRMRFTEKSQFGQEINSNSNVFNFDQLTESLGYAANHLAHTRYNA